MSKSKRARREQTYGSFVVVLSTGQSARFHDMPVARDWAHERLQGQAPGSYAAFYRAPVARGRSDTGAPWTEPFHVLLVNEYGRVVIAGHADMPNIPARSEMFPYRGPATEARVVGEARHELTGPFTDDIYKYRGASIELSSAGTRRWFATVRFRSQEKDFEAQSSDEALELAKEWIDSAPEFQGRHTAPPADYGKPYPREGQTTRVDARRSQELDSFTRAYMEAALWSSVDESGEPLDANYNITDFAPETRAEMIADCADFQKQFAVQLEASGLEPGQAGHYFWLSRNGHGAGFFDEHLDELQDAARSYGEYYLDVGDDGAIYGQGNRARETREQVNLNAVDDWRPRTRGGVAPKETMEESNGDPYGVEPVPPEARAKALDFAVRTYRHFRTTDRLSEKKAYDKTWRATQQAGYGMHSQFGAHLRYAHQIGEIVAEAQNIVEAELANSPRRAVRRSRR